MGEKQLHYAWCMDLRKWVFGLLCPGYSVGAMGGAALPEEAGKPNASCVSKGSISLCCQSSGGSCRQAECMCVILCMCFTRNTEMLSGQLSAWKPPWRNHVGYS